MVHCESVTLHSVTVHSVMNCYYIVKYSASESTAESEMITCHGQTVGAFIPRPTRPHLGNFSSAETTNITTPPDTCHECPPPTHGGCGAPGCAVRTAAVDSGCTIRADVAPIVVGQEIRKYENPFSYHRILAHVIRQLSNSPRPSHRGAGSIAFSSARHVTYLRKEGGRGKGGGLCELRISDGVLFHSNLAWIRINVHSSTRTAAPLMRVPIGCMHSAVELTRVAFRATPSTHLHV